MGKLGTLLATVPGITFITNIVDTYIYHKKLLELRSIKVGGLIIGH